MISGSCERRPSERLLCGKLGGRGQALYLRRFPAPGFHGAREGVLSSGFRPTFLVAVWRGGAPIGIAVQEVLEYHSIYVDHIAIRTSSYTGIDQQNKTVRVHAIDYLVSRLSAEDELLLVDDVFDSGRSLEAVIQELKQRCRRNWPEKWRIATVYYKSKRNRSTLVPDYHVRDTDKWLVFPHELIGLTREEILENKPVGPDFFDKP